MQITQTRGLWNYLKAIFLATLLVVLCAGSAMALTSTSNNYQVDETEFNAGGSLNSCSGQYCARASIGDLGDGSASNGATTAAFGSITPDEPLLEVIVDPGESNLGLLNTETTASKTMTVRVRNYLSNGYVLQITGDPPKYENHSLSTSSTLGPATPGTEQFAINAATNTSPAVGANPLQVPSVQTSFGSVEPGYSVPNMFKYVSGDIVARSQSESGRTDYTISMIVNISNSTPAGRFAADYSAIVTPVY